MKALYALTLLSTLAGLVTFALCDTYEEMEKFHKACIAESNTTEDEFKKFFDNGMKASDATNNIKCHMKCLMEKQGIFKNGVYNAEAGLKLLLSIPAISGHENEIKQAVNSCKNERGANDCDTAFKISMCIKEFKAQL
uniref:Odorant binding protein 4 n=1 Tax=Carpomya vesuviana TaxID=946126 RepID=A0A159ZTV4_9MUSC|nr:odorant binding protein 4 [Carpomya vesuviana]